MTTRPTEKQCVEMWENSTSPAEYEAMYDKFMYDLKTERGIEVTVDSVKVAALMDYTEDIEDIDSNYPTTDELDNMGSFLSHYSGFVNKVDECLSPSDTIALYGIYMKHNYGKVRRFI